MFFNLCDRLLNAGLPFSITTSKPLVASEEYYKEEYYKIIFDEPYFKATVSQEIIKIDDGLKTPDGALVYSPVKIGDRYVYTGPYKYIDSANLFNQIMKDYSEGKKRYDECTKYSAAVSEDYSVARKELKTSILDADFISPVDIRISYGIGEKRVEYSVSNLNTMKDFAKATKKLVELLDETIDDFNLEEEE